MTWSLAKGKARGGKGRGGGGGGVYGVKGQGESRHLVGVQGAVLLLVGRLQDGIHVLGGLGGHGLSRDQEGAVS